MQTIAARSGLFLGIFLLMSCGGGDAVSVSPDSYLGSHNPGDIMEVDLFEDTFEVTDPVEGITWKGTKEELDTGFLKMTVTETDPSDVFLAECVETPCVAYAVEYPQTALLLKPVGDEDILRAGWLGDCPTEDQEYIWVGIPGAGNNPQEDIYGTALADVEGSSITFKVQVFAMTDVFDPTGDVVTSGPWTCDEGKLTNTEIAGETGVITPSKVLILDFGLDGGGVAAIAKPETDLDMVDLANQDYRGFLFNQFEFTEEPSDEDSARPVGAASVPGEGSETKLRGFAFADVETGEEWQECEAAPEGDCSVYLTMETQVSPGIITGTIVNDVGDVEDFLFIAGQIDGQYIFFGATADDVSMMNFFMVEFAG